MRLEDIPGWDDLDKNTQDHMRNLDSILKEYDTPIKNGPDVPDLKELMFALFQTMQSMILLSGMVGEMIDDADVNKMANIYIGAAYNMGLNRGRTDAVYQIERAVAQLDPIQISAKYADEGINLGQIYNKSQAVRAQLQMFLNSLKEDDND